MALVAHKLISHLQNGNVAGLLEKTAMAMNGYVEESSRNELNQLIESGKWREAITLMGRLVAENEKNKILMKRLDMIIFFHERRQNSQQPSIRKISTATDAYEQISEEDISFLQNEASSLPGLDLVDLSDTKIHQEATPAIISEAVDNNGDDAIITAAPPADTLEPKKNLSLQEEIDGVHQKSLKVQARTEPIDTKEVRNEKGTIFDAAIVSIENQHNEIDHHPEIIVRDEGEDYLDENFTYELTQDVETLLEVSGYQIIDTQTKPDPGEADHDFGDEYAAYAYDPDEIYDAIEDQLSVLETSVSREDRARQVAADLITRTGWTPEALPLIQQIFYISGWGATRVSLEREINQGLTLDELILASHLKVIWSENEKYWIAFDKNGNGLFSHYIISWPTALLVVRTFDAMPQIEELEVFVEGIYEHWIDSPHLTRAFRSFSRYLWFRTARLEGCLPPDEPFSFESPHELPEEEYSDLGYYDSTRHEIQIKLNELGTRQVSIPRKNSLSYGAWCEYADNHDLEDIYQVMNSDARTSTDYEEPEMELDHPEENEYDY